MIVKHIFLIVIAVIICNQNCDVFGQLSIKKTSALELVIENPLLLISTLDGSLVAVEQQTGDVKWKLIEEPVVKVPVDNDSNSVAPLFLPDPKDGSLYIMGGPSGLDVLKKLPFTIPQLVASSPCRSSDGILYTGRKVDSWIAVDPDSGKKHQVLSYDKHEFQVCPADRSHTIFIGRTEYNIMMFDSFKKQRRWNVTFYDYNAELMDSESLINYGLSHFATNSVGRVVTLNRNSGEILWQQEFDSPAVAMYLLQQDTLVSVPFTSVALDTLESLKATISGADTKLSPTLYVGHHHHGLYALPSLIDRTITATILPPKNPLQIEGPKNSSKNKTQETSKNVNKDSSNPLDFLLGHYQMPEYSQTRLEITGKAEKVIESTSNPSVASQTESFDSPEIVFIWEQVATGKISALFSYNGMRAIVSASFKYFINQEQKMLKSFLILIVVSFAIMFWYLHVRMKQIQELTSNQLSNQQQVSTGSRGSSHPSEIDDQVPDDLNSHVVKVGKIELIPDQVLGRGCEGTFVFHGRFEGRPVAVKRLLPECFTVADREVDLLRESDEHPNVIRYFCTEKDRQFRYIALELCAATLEDYVQGRFGHGLIKDVDVLSQATSGLAHLHSLDIVHRDIKPHNVLLSHVNNQGQVKAMISDFGLCKKLQRGRHSFSHRSGIAGTDGWIAPEMINPHASATCSVDIFSMGCVFFYVLSKGKHPFGDSLRRQANILSGEHNLDELQGNENALQYNLVYAMISQDPTERPPASAVIKHPFFWDASRTLTFFQDVSDRVESEEVTSSVLQSLEESSWAVVRKDWRRHVGEEVASDLRKYRNYHGHSVRDLMRALRNKKHHYRDLSEEAKKSLGEVPTQFLLYWTSRFPLLLVHSWLAMQCVKHEKGLDEYYHPSFKFSKNFTVTLAASDNIIEVEETPPAQSSPRYDARKSKHRKKPSPDPIWAMNWRDNSPKQQEGEENCVDEKMEGEWAKVWPDGRRSHIRIRKKTQQDPIWKINWRDPTQSMPEQTD